MNSRFASAIFAKLFILLFLGYCDGQVTSRTLTIHYWDGVWNFTGFAIGRSTDYYYLISSYDDNKCAVIRENSSNVVTWAKSFYNFLCQGITVSADESQVFITSQRNSELLIFEISAVDGSPLNYMAAFQLDINRGVYTMLGNQITNLMYAGGVTNVSGDS